MKLLIGERISWIAGKTLNKGVFVEDLENGFSKVVSHFNGNRPHVREMEVLSSILKKGW